MMFKNSLKLLMANFATVWKLLVYKILVLGIITGLFFIGFSFIQGMDTFVSFWDSIVNFIFSFNVGASIMELLQNALTVFQEFFIFVGDLAVNGTGMFIYYTFIFVLLFPFLWKLSDLAVGETLYGYMASLTKYSFVGSMIRLLGKSCIYSLLTLAIMLPINALIIAGLYGILSLVSFGGFTAIMVPFLIFIYLSAFAGLKMAFFSGWMPAIIVFNCNAVKGLKLGFKAVFRRFFKVLSTSVIIVAVILAINMLFGSFSFIITIPVGSMILLVFQMVMFFGSQGMRYYVDLDTILSPKKLEETDKLKKVKDLI